MQGLHFNQFMYHVCTMYDITAHLIHNLFANQVVPVMHWITCFFFVFTIISFVWCDPDKICAAFCWRLCGGSFAWERDLVRRVEWQLGGGWGRERSGFWLDSLDFIFYFHHSWLYSYINRKMDCWTFYFKKIIFYFFCFQTLWCVWLEGGKLRLSGKRLWLRKWQIKWGEK